MLVQTLTALATIACVTAVQPVKYDSQWSARRPWSSYEDPNQMQILPSQLQPAQRPWYEDLLPPAYQPQQDPNQMQILPSQLQPARRPYYEEPLSPVYQPQQVVHQPSSLATCLRLCVAADQALYKNLNNNLPIQEEY
ncbi:uncharacterized protein LOC126976645 [Leptidea sinapis]|uniref:uncharacterized protein LOC126976645 n=1 Tax=Leptidea sinapis TaxID=189913 RepID=UPI0021335126|nr:uncharacterized protein LOC126976645 [Leptidea sinapis]XP_050681091.1 uncharacterized protein LOC126976645 [Leptidea sinapis]